MLIPPLDDFGDGSTITDAAVGGGVVEIVVYGSADEDEDDVVVGGDLSYDILAYPLLEIVVLVGVIVAVSPSPLINVKPDDLVLVVADFFVLLVSIQLDLLYDILAYPLLLLLALLVSPPLFDT